MGFGWNTSGYFDLPMATVCILQLQLQGICCFRLGSCIAHQLSLLKHADVEPGLNTNFTCKCTRFQRLFLAQCQGRSRAAADFSAAACCHVPSGCWRHVPGMKPITSSLRILT